ncbi:Pc18g06170 [Penicillium rubens Wisconsin 54-1255]|uniref:Pc18g06170 protein n=1 Tax=Penicillium rubens (strain ATCC 28089 / DSM 1075 / NRRL 1951 / Wisconsin 54-1255) TaxID=500485 RepID=B6HCJ4_PENRW|nr:Pc18g06170 [Penicillium rubens Wisconsin 54-1255]
MAFKALSLKERKRGGDKLKSSAQSLSIPHWGWDNHDIPTIMLYNQAWKPGPQIWQTNGAIRTGIVSIGEMGPGMTRLLKAHDYRVITVAEVRRQKRKTTRRTNGRRLRTARRIAEVCALPSTGNPREATEDVENQSKRPKLHYLELNALSARLASEMAAQSNEPTTATGRGRGCHFLDGGISWGPPQSTQDCSWKKPSVVSRSYRVDEVDVVGVVGAGGILLAHCCTRNEWVVAMSPKPYRYLGPFRKILRRTWWSIESETDYIGDFGSGAKLLLLPVHVIRDALK